MDTNIGASPSVMYARIFGIVLTLVGLLGLAVTTNQDAVESLLGFDVNLTHNLVHLGSGVLGLVAGFALLSWARPYAIVLGIVYTILGVWGLVADGTFDPFGLFVRINTADHILHLVIGVLGLGAGFAAVTTIDDRDATHRRARGL